MSAAELRQAAGNLRGLALAEGEWPCREYISSSIRHLERNCDVDCWHGEWSEEEQKYIGTECPAEDGSWDRYSTAAYIATMHPGVGLALARMLDDVAAGWVWDDPEAVRDYDGDPLNLEGSMDSHALTLARLINGGAA